MKQSKIMEVNDCGIHLECIKTDDQNNPYRLYRVWWNQGNHRKLIDKYGDFHSVIEWMYQNIKQKEVEQ